MQLLEGKKARLYRSANRGETSRWFSKDERIVLAVSIHTRGASIQLTRTTSMRSLNSFHFELMAVRHFVLSPARTHIDITRSGSILKNPKKECGTGQDGGIAVSYDGGRVMGKCFTIPPDSFTRFTPTTGCPSTTLWEVSRTTAPGPVRVARVNPGIMNDDWRMVSFGDGFYIVNNPDDPELYVSESQGGDIVRTDFRSREQRQ